MLPRLRRALHVTLTTACLASSACVPARHTNAPATLEGDLDLPGLSAPARVVTDRHGIPHLQAASLEDLYLVWGFVDARDRLWQMEHMRRGAQGALWEWFGNRTLREDGGAQLFRLAERSRAIWARDSLDPTVRVPLERYASGVNAYLARCRAGAVAWPEEFVSLGKTPSDWRPADSVLLLLAQGLVLDLSVPEIQEREDGAEVAAQRRRFEDRLVYTTIPDAEARQRYGPAEASAAWRSGPAGPGLGSVLAPRDGATSLSSWLRGRDESMVERASEALGRASPELDHDSRASNVFAVGPDLSASGKPLLANDPHLGLTTPGTFHVVHVNVGAQVDAIGAALPGLPLIASGRSRSCAWGVTALSADVMDLYADTLSADRKRVRFGGEWVDLEVHPFDMRYTLAGPLRIPIPGRSRVYTPHGPVLVTDEKRGVALSLRWAGDDARVTLSRLLGLERSANASEVAARVQSLVTPGLNVIAADTLGGIVYQAGGALPRRGFVMPRGAIPGDGAHEWRGEVLGHEMPAWSAPRNAVVVNANNLPVGSAYPEPLPRFDWAHDRAHRIDELLRGRTGLTAADLAAAQNDFASRAAARFVPRLIRAAEGAEALSPRARAALDTLRAWDFSARRGRVGPTLYRGWLGALQQRSKLGSLSGLTLAALDGEAPEALPSPKAGGRETPSQAAVAALTVALADLEKHLGPDLSTWTWERAHRAVFTHALAWKEKHLSPAPTPADGDNSTPCVGRSSLPRSLDFTHGAVFRHVVDLGVPDSSIGLVVPGNAGGGAHARDLLQRWADHEYVPFHLGWDRIEALRESELRLVPGSR